MLKLEVGRLLELHERLTVEKGNFERAQHELTRAGAGHIKFSAGDLRKLLSDVSDVERISDLARLTSTQTAAARTKDFLSHAPLTDPNFAGLDMQRTDCATAFRHLSDIVSRVRDDCAKRLYFQIAPENAELLRPDVPHFGASVEKAFGAAAEDIAEAANCLALERATACVFHLMRGLEVAAQAVATKIGAAIVDANGRGLSWGVIARNMKDKIDKMPASDEQTEWYRAQSFLVVVNRAWRVPTAHPKQTYTPDEARQVFDAAKAFMQQLSALV
jgi:hypothetical protein